MKVGAAILSWDVKTNEPKLTKFFYNEEQKQQILKQHEHCIVLEDIGAFTVSAFVLLAKDKIKKFYDLITETEHRENLLICSILCDRMTDYPSLKEDILKLLEKYPDHNNRLFKSEEEYLNSVII